MKSLFASLAAMLVLALGLGPASAFQTGTPAWTTAPLAMLEGPGEAYHVVGQVDGKVRVYVERCARLWCKIRTDGDRGWVSLRYIAFGHEARVGLLPNGLAFNGGGPGTVCLYEGHNFTGASICGGPGFVIPDLLLYHRDNAFSSVSIEGNVSVKLCRDRDFHSYCERVNASQSALQGFLDNGVSSVRIY